MQMVTTFYFVTSSYFSCDKTYKSPPNFKKILEKSLAKHLKNFPLIQIIPLVINTLQPSETSQKSLPTTCRKFLSNSGNY